MAVHLLTCTLGPTAQAYLAQLDHTHTVILLTPLGSELTLRLEGGPRLFSMIQTTASAAALPQRSDAQPITMEQLVELIAQDGPAITWAS